MAVAQLSHLTGWGKGYGPPFGYFGPWDGGKGMMMGAYGGMMMPPMFGLKGKGKGKGKSPLKVDPAKKVWIGNIPEGVQWKELQTLVDSVVKSKWVEIFRGKGTQHLRRLHRLSLDSTAKVWAASPLWWMPGRKARSDASHRHQQGFLPMSRRIRLPFQLAGFRRNEDDKATERALKMAERRIGQFDAQSKSTISSRVAQGEGAPEKPRNQARQRQKDSAAVYSGATLLGSSAKNCIHSNSTQTEARECLVSCATVRSTISLSACLSSYQENRKHKEQ
ncbi:unnamed protein product [Durusdinium trenchii]|uniref:RRM domain-containing protein n=1 Tax=Durusdinium trenchii TaxID=1381693 RepID=A0ABP0LB78_9DINO